MSPLSVPLGCRSSAWLFVDDGNFVPAAGDAITGSPITADPIPTASATPSTTFRTHSDFVRPDPSFLLMVGNFFITSSLTVLLDLELKVSIFL